MKRSYSRQLLIAANLVPLLGVLFFGWSLFGIMVLFWSENLIIGFFNIFKILKAEGGFLPDGHDSSLGSEQMNQLKKLSSLPLALFFSFHYGIFVLVHGIFIFTLFRQAGFVNTGIFAAFLGMFMSHGYSFWRNFIIKKEYKSLTKSQAMELPYRRLTILHITIIFGGFAVTVLGAPVLALAFLVILKTALDLSAHSKEHKMKIILKARGGN